MLIFGAGGTSAGFLGYVARAYNDSVTACLVHSVFGDWQARVHTDTHVCMHHIICANAVN